VSGDAPSLSANVVTANSLSGVADESLAISHMGALMLLVCGLMFALVLAFIGAMLVRARRGRNANATPEPGHISKDDRRLGIGLALWSALITLGLFVLAIGSFLADRALTAGTPFQTVRVTASQWWWQVDYAPGDAAQRVTTANELHLPLGLTTLVELASNDVIHSLWIPSLNGKTDLIPGRINHIRYTPRAVGRYRGECAEFCGLQHAKMNLDVVVETPAEFTAWLAHQRSGEREPKSATSARGQHVFMTSACVMCHAIGGAVAGANSGPDLTHFATRLSIAAGVLPMTRDSLKAWIADPQGRKPGTNMPRVALSSADLDAVVDYLLDLK
jgi:cytochrome c oxidase subunit 2